jgi:hypothetical protein
MKGKLTEIQAVSSSYDILCFTETHLDPTISDEYVLDSNHKTIYRKDRDIHGGGVLIAINKYIDHSPVKFEGSEELIGIFIPGVIDTLIFCIYIPPTKASAEIFSVFDNIDLNISQCNVLFVGDFNLPDIDWHNYTVKEQSRYKTIHQNFLNDLLQNNFEQMIFEPTHR